MNMRTKLISCAAIAAAVIGSASAGAAGFSHGLSGTKPWTNENFLDDPQEFHFAIIGDRTGGERPGFFGKTMDALNLLRPEFTICVGDLVAGGGVPESALRKQWSELKGFIARLEMPFFYVVGNHDMWTGITGMTPARQTSIDLWKENCGTNTYYSFLYKGCQFICFNTMERHDYFPPHEPLSENQIAWALGEMAKQRDARWHFLFMHKPIDWTSDRWLAFERQIAKYDYIVFCGDWHNFCTATRHGKKYYMLGTCGGGWDGEHARDAGGRRGRAGPDAAHGLDELERLPRLCRPEDHLGGGAAAGRDGLCRARLQRRRVGKDHAPSRLGHGSSAFRARQ